MGLFDRLRGELVDIIEWVDDDRHTLVWRFPRYRNEIKNGAQLIVRPGQTAIFVSNGRLADIFEPGHYTLATDNLPLLSSLQGWKHGFESPFKSEVYFVSTRTIGELKWGTRTRSCSATRTSARCACGRSAPIRCGPSTRRPCSKSWSARTPRSRPGRSPN